MSDRRATLGMGLSNAPLFRSEAKFDSPFG